MANPSAFLAACRREHVPHTPVWIMRQAGRYLPEYRAVRERVGFLELTKTPELVAEVTLQPIRRFGMDAAILFSDIMTPVEGMGFELDFDPGPVIANPVRSTADVERLRVPDPEESVPWVQESIRILCGELGDTPLIGFGGAPFTLFCYAVQGQGSKTFLTARSFLMAEPEAAIALLDKLAATVGRALLAQAAAGAQALMIFDSWIGLLAPADFRRFALPTLHRLVQTLRPTGVPLIYFPNGGSTLLEAASELDVDVLGIDWRTPLPLARKLTGGAKALQGNLDPAALFARPAELDRRIDLVLTEAQPSDTTTPPGHIFNLGHGIEPQTNPDAVARLIDRVHQHHPRRA